MVHGGVLLKVAPANGQRTFVESIGTSLNDPRHLSQQLWFNGGCDKTQERLRVLSETSDGKGKCPECRCFSTNQGKIPKASWFLPPCEQRDENTRAESIPEPVPSDRTEGRRHLASSLHLKHKLCSGGGSRIFPPSGHPSGRANSNFERKRQKITSEVLPLHRGKKCSKSITSARKLRKVARGRSGDGKT